MKLSDLNKYRDAPNLSLTEKSTLLLELKLKMSTSDWFTLGIMAKSQEIATKSLRSIEKYFNWKPMKLLSEEQLIGPVYLKANQKNGIFYIRVEHGLKDGILVSCQNNDNNKNAETYGPFPLDIFQKN
tara:strand:- start:235 stop:618 length:384 start_codon:yes stop_codon:yes gene_type:complete